MACQDWAGGLREGGRSAYGAEPTYRGVKQGPWVGPLDEAGSSPPSGRHQSPFAYNPLAHA